MVGCGQSRPRDILKTADSPIEVLNSNNVIYVVPHEKIGICPLPRFHSYSSWNKIKFVLIMILVGMFGFDKQRLEKNSMFGFYDDISWNVWFR